MSHPIDYSSIGWEQFEDLCVDLWFDEGYTGVRPYGRQREHGRDAVYVDETSGDLTIFQFKRWTAAYSTAKLKQLIQKAACKVAPFKPKRFILNSPLSPNASVNDWIPSLQKCVGFEVQYYDRRWLELRLDNNRQDLRRRYFGHTIEHHSFHSLLSAASTQVASALKSLSLKFDPMTYVHRDAEAVFDAFLDSDRPGLIIVDHAGRGKTNLLCALAQRFISEGKPALLLEADALCDDDNKALVRSTAVALGYPHDQLDAEVALADASKALRDKGAACVVLLDGLSECAQLLLAVKALEHLLTRVDELCVFKVVVALRDTALPVVEYRIETNLLYRVRPAAPTQPTQDRGAFQLHVGDFSDAELTSALPLYCSKYDVVFTPSPNARRQLRHPLLLRLFCESKEHQRLGTIDSVPVARTFEHYLQIKTAAVTVRTDAQVSAFTVRSILAAIAGQGWLLGDAQAIPEPDLMSALPPTLGADAGRLPVNVLEAEGIIVFREEPLRTRRTAKFLFDELHDYLLLRYLLDAFVQPGMAGADGSLQPESLLEGISRYPKAEDHLKLLSLVGMLVGDVAQRKAFLHRLLQWDFHTFATCLANVPPVGELTLCDSSSLELLASNLRNWYELILSESFPELLRAADPWYDDQIPSHEGQQLGIELTASPACKEIVYKYRIVPAAEAPIRVAQVSRYPVVGYSLMFGDKTLELHDPEHGVMLPYVRMSGPGAMVERILNLPIMVPFPGASLNVPERIALFDVRGEIENLVQQGQLPQQCIPLVMERARFLARSIPGLGITEGLTPDHVEEKWDGILAEFPEKSPQHTKTRGKLEELGNLLRVLGRPLETKGLPEFDRASEIEAATADDAGLQGEFREYLYRFMHVCLLSYRVLVESNFASVEDQLNLYVQWPFTLIMVSDLRHLRYVVMPEKDIAESVLGVNMVLGEQIDVGDPLGRIEVNKRPHIEVARERLKEINKLRPPIHPIDRTATITDFLGPTPVNDQVKQWLLLDLADLFGS